MERIKYDVKAAEKAASTVNRCLIDIESGKLTLTLHMIDNSAP